MRNSAGHSRARPEQYHVDVEDGLAAFDALLRGDDPIRRIFVLTGVGGMGKSSLLEIFRIRATRSGYAVAQVDAADYAAPEDVLRQWGSDFAGQGMATPALAKQLQRLGELQLEIEKGWQRKVHAAAGLVSRGVTRAAENLEETRPEVRGLGLSTAAAFSEPMIEAAIDSLRGKLRPDDVRLVRNPLPALSGAFCDDLAVMGRILLVLDTLERSPGLATWLRELRKSLPLSVRLVVAGRDDPDWQKRWPGWQHEVVQYQMQLLSPDHVRELIRRYATLDFGEGALAKVPVEEIVAFARGLPLAAATATQLCLEYDYTDFSRGRAEVVGDLVRRIRDSVAESDLPLIDALSVVRRLDADLMSALLGTAGTNEAYERVRRLDFIRDSSLGLVLHDAVRPFFVEVLRREHPDRYRSLHAHAAEIFAQRAAADPGQIAEDWIREEIHHRWAISPASGFSRLREEMTSALARSRLDLTGPLLEEVTGRELPPGVEGTVEFWRGTIAHRRGDWAAARNHLERSTRETRTDPHVLLRSCIELGQLVAQQGFLSEARIWYEKSLEITRSGVDPGIEGYIMEQIAKVWRLEGRLPEAIQSHEAAIERARSSSTYDQCSTLGSYGTTLMFAGRFPEAERSLRESVRMATENEFVHFRCTGLRSMSAALRCRGALDEAYEAAQESLAIAEKLHDPYNAGFAKLMLAEIGLEAAAELPIQIARLESARQVFVGVRARYDLINTEVALARARFASGDRALARAALESAGKLLDDTQFTFGRYWYLVLSAESRLAGHGGGTASVMDECRALAESLGSPYLKIHQRLSALQSVVQADSAELEALRDQAVREGYPDLAALACCRIAEDDGAAGHEERAVEWYVRAWRHALEFHVTRLDQIARRTSSELRQTGLRGIERLQAIGGAWSTGVAGDGTRLTEVEERSRRRSRFAGKAPVLEQLGLKTAI